MTMRITLSSSLLCALAPLAHSQCEVEKLTDNVPAAGQGFGAAVAMHGDHAVIGIPFDDPICAGCDTGVIDFYERTSTGWIQGQRLTGSLAVPGSHFGAGVALHGDIAVAVTDRFTPPVWVENVTVFERDAGVWSETQSLVYEDWDGAGFGHSAIVAGDTILIAAPWAYVQNFTSSGVIACFEKVNGLWSMTQALRTPQSINAHANHFGKSMSLDGDTLAVGMPQWSVADRGTAFVFVRKGGAWTQSGPRLNPADSAAGDNFGELVAVSGTTALVWSPGKSDIYIFESSPSGWGEAGKLQTLDGTTFDDITLDFSGGIALVGVAGAPGPLGAPDVGATYVFERVGGNLVQTAKIYASDASAGARFGAAIDINGGVAMIAAPGDAGDVGAVYAFAFDRPRNYCTSSANSSGAPAIMGYQGSASVSAGDLILTVGPAPASQPGLMYYGSDEISVPFGAGTRCVGGASGTIFRFPTLVSSGAGEFQLPIDYTAPPASLGHPGALSPGATRKFQLWFRDPLAGGLGWNLSDGLSVTFCP